MPWNANAPALRRKVWFFWYGAVPIATPLFGYFPGKRLGMVGDLPRGVIEQWRRWCLNPEYAVGVEPDARARFAEVTTPIVSFSFDDDEMMSERNIASLHSFYVNAPKTMRRMTPKDVGVKRVGHFGFFRKEMETPLWQAHVAPELAVA
jgi:predicted alpha/beta hydrolase